MGNTADITNTLVTEYINEFYVPVNESLSKLRQKSEDEKVPIILKESEMFLRVLLGIVNPKRILEIGTAVGYSASVFAALTDAKIFTIEKDPDIFRMAEDNISSLGYSEKITVLQGDGAEVVEELKESGEATFDFVFIDAAKSHYKRFFDASLGLISPNGVIVSDNVIFRARVVSDDYDPSGKHKTNIKKLREYNQYISTHPQVETTILACGDGLAVSRLK